jgi:hypothetical protein
VVLPDCLPASLVFLPGAFSLLSDAVSQSERRGFFLGALDAERWR